MSVTFKPKVIQICHEIRELQALDYILEPELIVYLRQAGNYTSFARHLQQIASFHNTIGDRMIKCHRPIMLYNAKELCGLVKSRSISWKDEEFVIEYIFNLQNAVNKLQHDNQLLLSYHENIMKIVS